MTRNHAPVEHDGDLAQVVTGHGPCTFLLLALLALILVYPYLKESPLPRVCFVGVLTRAWPASIRPGNDEPDRVKNRPGRRAA